MAPTATRAEGAAALGAEADGPGAPPGRWVRSRTTKQEGFGCHEQAAGAAPLALPLEERCWEEQQAPAALPLYEGRIPEGAARALVKHLNLAGGKGRSQTVLTDCSQKQIIQEEHYIGI